MEGSSREEAPVEARTEADLLRIFRDSRAEPRARVAALNDPRVSRASVLAIVDACEPCASLALACTADSALLDMYADSVDPEMRATVAYNARTPSLVVERLAEDEDRMVRLNAVCNGNLSRATRVLLSRSDPDPEVRATAWKAMSSSRGRRVIAGQRFEALTFVDEWAHFGSLEALAIRVEPGDALVLQVNWEPDQGAAPGSAMPATALDSGG